MFIDGSKIIRECNNEDTEVGFEPMLNAKPKLNAEPMLNDSSEAILYAEPIYDGFIILSGSNNVFNITVNFSEFKAEPSIAKRKRLIKKKIN